MNERNVKMWQLNHNKIPTFVKKIDVLPQIDRRKWVRIGSTSQLVSVSDVHIMLEANRLEKVG